RGALIKPGCDLAAVVVDRVVAAPQDPVIRGEPVVVELVAGIADALPVPPADAGQLGRRERSGHEHVVIHRHEEIPEPAQQWRDRPGRERRPVGQNAALRCGQREAPALPAGLVADRSNGGVLVDPYPGGQAGLPEPPGEPGRVDGRTTIAIPKPAKVRW